MFSTAAPDLSGVASVHEVLPMNPAMLTGETPFTMRGAGDKKADCALSRNDLKTMQVFPLPLDNVTRLTDECPVRCVLYVAAEKQERSIGPRMIVERSVVVAGTNIV